MKQPHPVITELPDDVLRAVVSGRKNEAITLLRDLAGLGPVDARRVIDDFIKHNPKLLGVQGAREYAISSRLMLIGIILLLGALLLIL